MTVLLKMENLISKLRLNTRQKVSISMVEVWNNKSNWYQYPNKLERIIKSISMWSIKDTLKYLYVDEWEVTKGQVKKMLDDCSMIKVKIYAHTSKNITI